MTTAFVIRAVAMLGAIAVIGVIHTLAERRYGRLPGFLPGAVAGLVVLWAMTQALRWAL